MKLSKFDRLLLAALAVIALLTVALIVNFRNTRGLWDDAVWVSHTHTVLDTLEETRSRLREAEAIQRTFVIVGGDATPAEFSASIAAARQAAVNARGLTADNPQQHARFPE